MPESTEARWERLNREYADKFWNAQRESRRSEQEQAERLRLHC